MRSFWLQHILHVLPEKARFKFFVQINDGDFDMSDFIGAIRLLSVEDRLMVTEKYAQKVYLLDESERPFFDRALSNLASHKISHEKTPLIGCPRSWITENGLFSSSYKQVAELVTPSNYGTFQRVKMN